MKRITFIFGFGVAVIFFTVTLPTWLTPKLLDVKSESEKTPLHFASC